MTSAFGPGGPGSGPFDDFLAQFLSGRGMGGASPRGVQRIDITQLMTEPARQLVGAAAQQAAERGNADLDAWHLLHVVTQVPPLRQLLAGAGADPDALQRTADEQLPRGEARTEPPSLTPTAKRTLLDAHQISRALGSSYIGPEHIVLALAANNDSPVGRALGQQGVTPQSLQRSAASGGQRPGAGQGGGGGQGDSGTPTVDQFGVDLTAKARAGELDPVVGREDEVDQTMEVLSRRTKNNPVLIGEAGVGKTAVVEGIAQRIVAGDVPEQLEGKRIVQLDLSGMVAGTRYRGDFEERMTKVVAEIREHSDELIVFIDELHGVVGAGGSSEGGMDAGNILKPALARGELHIVGATTLDEYRQSIEKDAALERRFQPVMVPEPSVADTIAILHGLRDRYEAHHQVRFTDEALTAAAELSERYVTDRFLPDKAIDLVDQAGARKRLRAKGPHTDSRELERRLESLQRDKDQAVADEDYERAGALRDEIAEAQAQLEQARSERRSDQPGVLEVSVDDIAEVVSRSTGIPVAQLTETERDRLLKLEEQLHERVVGQDDAVAAIAEAVRRSRAGLGDPDRPIGSFLFLGPTGVGKTELAKALAAQLFGDEDRMVRVDMSEYSERHTVSRLVGSPPGYVGYGEAGQLTEEIRRRPYSVVLLDEMEKAHPDVFNTLLQVLDDGRLTDSQGRTVDFRNTVLIMTSNVGSELITTSTQALGFAPSNVDPSQSLQDRLMPRLRESFRPEFLNRIDEVIVFKRLDQAQLRRITDLLLDETRERLAAQDIGFAITEAAVDHLAELGFQPEFGARPLRRTIQRQLGNRLSSMLLADELHGGQTVTVDVGQGETAGELTFAVDAPAAASPVAAG
ncbi:ATP-dependent Clp protease ATP-binding subunit [Actinomycetospora cinnamomea]|uniref:ATP-dependent Clp protease ATP-binding subunit ClpC n=1 Tax=Actinomycetospora cinnamomea TaxID=663609 RepID=A0A2U1FLF4_9PSEU|nr:ATP-dependent Clp protease ATP-binding subunit [Actinomycetospora cinnamomea]PVZ12956.1 ATP-dependent Clp protease ATP-binding subunit ClpC [Actinomycetospora cinnamomea]